MIRLVIFSWNIKVLNIQCLCVLNSQQKEIFWTETVPLFHWKHFFFVSIYNIKCFFSFLKHFSGSIYFFFDTVFWEVLWFVKVPIKAFCWLADWDIASSTFESSCVSLLLGLLKSILAVKTIFRRRQFL